MLVEKLVSKTSVEALNDGILVRLARFDEMQLDAGVSAPLEQFSAGEFRAIIGFDGRRQRSRKRDAIEDPRNAFSGKREVDLKCNALAREIVDNG